MRASFKPIYEKYSTRTGVKRVEIIAEPYDHFSRIYFKPQFVDAKSSHNLILGVHIQKKVAPIARRIIIINKRTVAETGYYFQFVNHFLEFLKMVRVVFDYGHIGIEVFMIF